MFVCGLITSAVCVSSIGGGQFFGSRCFMKILYVIGDLSIGGAEVFTKNISIAITNFGATVEIACFDESRFLADELEAAGVVIHSLGKARFSFLTSAYEISKIVQDRKIDVIHAHSFSAAMRVVCSQVMGSKAITVMTYHNLGYEAYPPKNIYKKIRRFAEGLIFRSFFDHWIAVSSAAADSYKYHYGHLEVEVIHNGIDLKCAVVARAQSHSETWEKFEVITKGPVIILPGRLVWEKGHQIFISSMIKIIEFYPDALALIVGDGPLLNELIKYSRDTKVINNIKFMPGLSQEDLFALICSTDVVVIPSLSEGYGLLVAEAMALGVAVVCSDIKAIREVVGGDDNALLFQSGNSDLLASNILQLLDDTGKRTSLGAKALVRAERELSIQIVARRHLDRYQQLLLNRKKC